MARESHGKVPNLTRQLNESTGKQSTLAVGFNEVTWGARCRSYAKSANNLSTDRFDEIIRLASVYMKTTSRTAKASTTDTAEFDDDIRANIVDNSTSESEDDGGDMSSGSDCKLSIFNTMFNSEIHSRVPRRLGGPYYCTCSLNSLLIPYPYSIL